MSATSKHFIIATAGHVDHGKSALVKALTGTDPDRLPEEKKRQITIDLGFAELKLSAPNGDKILAGLIDVPGHEDFVRNMIAGVGSIDLALLVVAADDGWMPQTEEHFQILNYLGVQRAVIALTKSDLGRIDSVTDEIRNQLHGTCFEHCPIVVTSIPTGTGVGNLKTAIATELALAKPQRDVGKPRLFVDRVFTLRGIGTVITGTLTGGLLRVSQQIILYPTNIEARIRSIQSHGHQLEVAQPGMRTAINLPDIRVDQVERGDVVTIPGLGAPSSNLVALLEKSSRTQWESRALAPAIKSGSLVHLHHGTFRVAARIALRKAGRLEPGQQRVAQLKLASPIFAFVGDRFVVRDPAQQNTIAGGVVIDPEGHKQPLTSCGGADNVDSAVLRTISRHGFAQRENLLCKSQFSADEISEALIRLQERGQIILRQHIAAGCEFWRRLTTQAVRLIDQAHKRNPEHSGVDLNDVRLALRIQQPHIMEALVADLSGNNFVRKGSFIARASHRPSLPVHLQPIGEKIHQTLSDKPFDPPSRRDIESNPHARQVVRFLIESGDLIEIATDVIMLRKSFEGMRSEIAAFISKNGPATVSQLRQAMGSSRRVMVPLLERLDHEAFTRRMGDKRMLCRVQTA